MVFPYQSLSEGRGESRDRGLEEETAKASSGLDRPFRADACKVTKVPMKSWKTACSTGLLLTTLVLSACGAPQGPVINVNEDVAVELGREALEHARHHAGRQDVTPAEVVAGFDVVMEEEALREWWVAEAVGDSMTQISFLIISEEYKTSHPDVSYPLLGERAPTTLPAEKSTESSAESSTESSAVPTTEAPASGAEGLSAGERVVLSKSGSPSTTIAHSEDTGGHTETTVANSPGITTSPTETSDEHGATGAEPGLMGDYTETTVAGSPDTTMAHTESSGEHATTSDGHGAAGAERSLAGGLPREAFTVAVAACVRELYDELRIRGGACPGNAGGHGADASPSDTHTAAHWGYGADDGPATWGSLDEGYEKCKAGLEQSPVDLKAPVVAPIADTELRYRATEAASSDNGHTLKVSFDLGSSAVVEERSHQLIEVHFHASSEHTLDGKKFPIELHFVHKSQDGALAVVGVLVSQGAENTTWAPLIDALAGAEAVEAKPVGVLNIQQMMPEKPLVYRYKGSLTTPPCSEGVVWSVVAKPVEFSAAQIAKLTDRYSQNARDVQPLHERQLILDDAVG